jgi:hypothetical protein
MFRVERTYELLIARHEARSGENGRPPFVFSQTVFLGRQGHLSLELWGVVYTMNLDAPGIAELIAPLDVVLLAEWHAAEVPDLAQNVARAQALGPGKPIVLGLYLHDYGGGRPIPQDLLELQFENARRLLVAGEIAGIEITTIDNNESAVRWTSEWIRQHGDEALNAATP